MKLVAKGQRNVRRWCIVGGRNALNGKEKKKSEGSSVSTYFKKQVNAPLPLFTSDVVQFVEYSTFVLPCHSVTGCSNAP